MKTREEVEAMLSKLDGMVAEDMDGEPAEGVYGTLLWFLGQRSDDQVEGHIE